MTSARTVNRLIKHAYAKGRCPQSEKLPPLLVSCKTFEIELL